VKTYLINLDRSPERLAHMQDILAAAGVRHVRIAAVDGRALAPAAIAEADASLSPSEVACFMSHRIAWQAIASGDDPFGAVLEDDIHIAPSLAALLADGDWIPPGADVVKLETMLKPVYLEDAGHEAPAGHRVRRLHSTHPGTAGYIIGRAAAAGLVARYRHASRPADAYLFELPDGEARNLVVYQLDPAACIQDDQRPAAARSTGLASTIHTERREMRRAETNLPHRIFREVRRGAARLLEWQRGMWARRRGRVRKRVPFASPAERVRSNSTTAR
jgi:glycosyl transferase family 25